MKLELMNYSFSTNESEIKSILLNAQVGTISSNSALPPIIVQNSDIALFFQEVRRDDKVIKKAKERIQQLEKEIQQLKNERIERLDRKLDL